MKKNGIKKIVLSLVIGLFLSINFVLAVDCNAIFTPEAYDLIREFLGYVTIIVPILLIVLCSGDLMSIVTSQDEGVSKKAGGRIVKRFIAAAAFFFVPLLVRFVLGLEPVKNGLNLVDDPTCGITSGSTTPDPGTDPEGGTEPTTP
jgi:hypothetical protein